MGHMPDQFEPCYALVASFPKCKTSSTIRIKTLERLVEKHQFHGYDEISSITGHGADRGGAFCFSEQINLDQIRRLEACIPFDQATIG